MSCESEESMIGVVGVGVTWLVRGGGEKMGGGE